MPPPSNLDVLTHAQQHVINTSLGPMEIGNFLNSILLGVLLLQVGQYYINFRDPLWIRGLVGLVFIIDIAQSALMMFMTWDYTVTHFSDFDFLLKSTWTLSSIPFFSVPVSWVVQGFYAWRIFILTKTKKFSAIILLFALIQGAFGIYAGIGSFMINTTADNIRLQHIAIVWFVFAMLCDVTIMTVMIWSLSQAKTGFKDTDTLITKINRAVLETGAATSATVLIDCLFLFLIPGTDMHLVPVMAVGKVYSNSFLYLLNSRGSYRKVSSLRTAEFAQSLNERSYPGSGSGSGVTGAPMRVGAGGYNSGPRGLSALKFAPNESATMTRGTGRSVGLDSEVGVIVSRDTYVMTNLGDDERYAADNQDVKDSPVDGLDASSYVIDTKTVGNDDSESRRSDHKNGRDFP